MKTTVHKRAAALRGGGRRESNWESFDRHAAPDSPAITAERIVRLAIDLADRQGIEGISMRGIAAELGSGVMSLYHYVPSKGVLLDLMLDTALGEIDIPAPSGDWKGDLRRIAIDTRACLRRHVWAPSLLSSRAAMGPNRLAQMEFGLAAASGLGLSIKMMWRVTGSLYVYVFGFVALELSEGHALRRAECGLPPAPDRNRFLEAGNLPHLARYFAAGCPAPLDDGAFEDGLDLLLEGIGVMLRSWKGLE